MGSPLAPPAPGFRYYQAQSREPKRKKLVELIEQITRFKKVYPYQPSPRGQESPIAGVQSAGSGPSDRPLNVEDHFIVSIFVARDQDEAAAEDLIDDLAAAVRQVLADNEHTSEWYELEFDTEASDMDYTEPDDTQIMYRTELIFVTTKTECNQLPA